jgi:hypothetical protein
VRRPTSLLQTDAEVGWQSRHEFDASYAVSAVWMAKCVEGYYNSS